MEVTKLSNGITFLRDFGLQRTIREINFRIDNLLSEIRYGVDTSGYLESPEPGNAECFAYASVGYAAIRKALTLVPIPERDVSFLDIGAGEGRPCVVAASKHYRRVIGVEISRKLCEDARRNLDGMRGRRTERVEIVESDATQYDIPTDVNLIFIANSFGGSVLVNVIDKIEQTLRRKPRELYVVYFNKIHFEREIAGKQWIERIHESHEYPNFSLAVYRLK